MPTLSVRPIGIRDIASLRHLQSVHVSLAAQQALMYHLGADVLAAFPMGRRYWRAYVATVNSEVRALVELQPEPRDFRWQVTRLAAGVPDRDASIDVVDLWTELLAQAVRAAGGSGAKRLHAVSPLDGPAYEALRRATFTAYAQQTALLAHGLHPHDRDQISLREQEPSDAWSIHQLYHLATPRPIQYAEAFTSNHWDTGRRAGWRIRGFLAERGHEVTAYCRVTSRGRRHVVDVLTLPGEARLVRAIVPQAVARVGDWRRDAIWIAAPDYFSDQVSHLESLGFTPVERQTRMVRYTAVEVRARHRSLHLVPEVAERLPARVPTYSVASHLRDPAVPVAAVM